MKNSHDFLIEQALDHLKKIGATNIKVLDQAGRHKAPIPDIVAIVDGKKVAVECGSLVGGPEKRFEQLKKAGYEIIVHFPRLENFDISMLAPQYKYPWIYQRDEEYIRARIKAMGEAMV